VNASAEKWFSESSVDFALESNAVYIASDAGIYRVPRSASDHTPTLATAGTYSHVAVDSKGIYATRPAGATTSIVEVRAGTTVELAVAEGGVNAIAITPDDVYFAASRLGGAEIRRVAR
jgi:hypothetical protein